MTFDPDRLGPLGLGTASLGNLYRAIDDETAIATVSAAWTAGIRYFDTAPHYGLGLSESRLGHSLTGRARSAFVVSTKVGRLLVPGDGERPDDDFFATTSRLRRTWDFSADGVRRSLDGSRERLGLDRIDVALLHDPDDHVEQALGEALPALVALRDRGDIDAVGLGVKSVATALAFVRRADLDVLLLAGRCTLLDRSAEDELLPLCAARGVTVIAAGVYNSGVLASAQPAAGATYEYLPVSIDVLARAQELAQRCATHGVALPDAAIQYPRRAPAVGTVIVGAASPEEIRADAAGAAVAIPEALWAELAAVSDPTPADPAPASRCGAS